jgi:hypothetical protein
MPAYDDIRELRALRKNLCRALSRCVEHYGISARVAYKRLTDIPPGLMTPSVFDQERSSGTRGQPRKISYYLALYLIFVFKDILGGKLPFSRPNPDYGRPKSGSGPHGPAFEAIAAALEVAQWRLQYRVVAPLGYRLGRSALASLIEVTRDQTFEHYQDPAHFISGAASITLMVEQARKKRVVSARTRKKKNNPAD